jgi:hypothetical protein
MVLRWSSTTTTPTKPAAVEADCRIWLDQSEKSMMLANPAYNKHDAKALAAAYAEDARWRASSTRRAPKCGASVGPLVGPLAKARMYHQEQAGPTRARGAERRSRGRRDTAGAQHKNGTKFARYEYADVASLDLWQLLTFWIFAAIVSGRLIVRGQ